jgi:hypothetical protein
MESLFGSCATADKRGDAISLKGDGAERTVDARRIVDALALVIGLLALVEEIRRSVAVMVNFRRTGGERPDRFVASVSDVGCLERGDIETVDRILGERFGDGEAAPLDVTLALRAGGEVSVIGDDANEDLPSSQGSLFFVVRA